MTDPEQIERIATLLRETGEAHHEAFRESDGADPEWPLWYAEHLRGRLGAAIGAQLTRSELVYLLVLAGKEQAINAPGSDWRRYYARFFAERYQ